MLVPGGRLNAAMKNGDSWAGKKMFGTRLHRGKEPKNMATANTTDRIRLRSTKRSVPRYSAVEEAASELVGLIGVLASALGAPS